MKFIVDELPSNNPIEFMPDLVPDERLVHRGIFSPDLNEYYYTVSDENFEQFDTYFIKKLEDKWSKPEKSFFNSTYNEHGMSFSPDGKTMYFSSTRPNNINGISGIWKIWKSKKADGIWGKSECINIPNTKNKYVSHPSVSDSGTLYFHMSNLDYTEMDVYCSKRINGKYGSPEKIKISFESNLGKCTPYISPKEDYILFALIDEQLDLMISFNDGSGKWTNTRKLSKKINTLGQGNPYVTPNNEYLFFATGGYLEKKWSVKWISFKPELKNYNK